MSGRSSLCGSTTTRPLRTAGSTPGRFVALKVLPPHVMSRPDALSRFERELIYLIEYDDGRTALLTPSEFAAHFGWKNDPDKTELLGK